MKTIHVLVLSAGICFFAACNATKKTSSADASEATTEAQSITDRKWKLIELGGKPVADKINGREPFLRLGATDNHYSASGGCNGLGGAFTLENNGKVKFSQGVSTMMACENMEIEHGLNEALIGTDNYTLNGDTLSLNKRRMAPLARFVEVTDSLQ